MNSLRFFFLIHKTEGDIDLWLPRIYPHTELWGLAGGLETEINSSGRINHSDCRDMAIPESMELESSLGDPGPGGISRQFVSCHLQKQTRKSVLSG